MSAAGIGSACGHCHSCLLYQAGNHPDWTEIQPVESAFIRIDQIRELSGRLSMRLQIAQRQVALLWPAEQMNAASSMLLKTLEEPAADTHLLLVSDRAGRLSATIPQSLPAHADPLAARPRRRSPASRRWPGVQHGAGAGGAGTQWW